MSIYEIKTSDSTIHQVTAVTHIRDSYGLTLYAEGGQVAAMFTTFDWMRVSEPAAPAPEEPKEKVDLSVYENTPAEVVNTPVAEGE